MNGLGVRCFRCALCYVGQVGFTKLASAEIRLKPHFPALKIFYDLRLNLRFVWYNMRVKSNAEMSAGENQIVVYQPNETARLDTRAEIIPGLLASIRKATSERREYGKLRKSRG